MVPRSEKERITRVASFLSNFTVLLRWGALIPFTVCIDVDAEMCVFCGLCEIFCPFNAVKVYVDGKPLEANLKKDVLPEVFRELRLTRKLACVLRWNLSPTELATMMLQYNMIFSISAWFLLIVFLLSWIITRGPFES